MFPVAHHIPMRLLATPEPFDDPEFVYEPKLDGFRALAYVTGHRCELLSRNGHRFKSWPQLAEEIAHAVKAHNAVLDGEICCLQSDGRPNFHAVMFRRAWPWFYAFDVLSTNGQDLRALPLLERKRRLRTIVPRIECRLLYLDHSWSAAAIYSARRASVTSSGSWRSGRAARTTRTADVRPG
jgi:bifunctional non-homologous end joining protein LigD